MTAAMEETVRVESGLDHVTEVHQPSRPLRSVLAGAAGILGRVSLAPWRKAPRVDAADAEGEARPAAPARDVPARVIAVAAAICAVGTAAVVGLDRREPTAPGFAVAAPAASASIAVPEGVTPDQAALLMTTDYLATALARSDPFETELAVALRLVGDRLGILALLDELIVHAPAGVPSRADVVAAFAAEARAFEGEGAGAMFGRMESGLNGLLQYNRAALRREDEYRALSAEVAAGDLVAATERLSRLDGPVRSALDGWLEVAATRVRVDAIGGELSRRAHLAILGEGG